MDDGGFEAFWAKERNRLYRVLAVGLGDPELAGEAIDEAMARALQRWEKVASYDDPAGWVVRVARNWAVSWRRKLSRRPTVAAERLDRPSQDDVPDLDVRRVLSGLPEQQRTLLAMRFVLDWEIGRIAAALEIPEGTVKSRLHRTLRQLGDFEEVLR